MKKKLIIVAALAVAAISAYATVGFKSSCGKVIYTIDFDEVPEYMDPDDITNYYEELNEELCGTRDGYEIIHY